jgi:hypothetical protein
MRLVLLVLALVLAPAANACPRARASNHYAASIERVLRQGRDVWGDRLLRAPGGPTLAGARRFLPPLRYARTSGGRSLTASGVYYVPFGHALHVADGSEIYLRSTTGPSLSVSVAGRSFGACGAQLAEGWLPILETRDGRYAQESFAWDGVSYVRVDGPGPVRFVRRGGYSKRQGDVVAFAARPVGAVDYAKARASLVAYWKQQLGEGAQIEVPEPYVENALRALLVQNLQLTWHYSLGNPYEEFSFPESLDGAQVMAEYGFDAVARSMVRVSLTRRPTPYPAWKMGEKLIAATTIARLSGDRQYLTELAPALQGYVRALGRSMGSDGLLARERYSSDIADQVRGLHAQAVVWQGLRAIGADTLAGRLEAALRRAVRADAVRLPDGSLFVPMRLGDDEPAYRSVVESRDGSYWNLVAPYAFASGLLTKEQADGALRYLLIHGSRLLGLVRAAGIALYGRDAPFPVSGTDEVYGVNIARFLGAEDASDQLVLSLYGDLAAGMTPNTFVSGEGASVAPLDGLRDRAMYLPPNSVSNDAFLETLRQMLVQEVGDGLRVAPATPRAWLAPGKRIVVQDLPTSFGPLSYELEGRRGSVHVVLDVPSRRPPRTLVLRLRLPHGTRTVDLSGRRGRVDLDLRVS